MLDHADMRHESVSKTIDAALHHDEQLRSIIAGLDFEDTLSNRIAIALLAASHNHGSSALILAKADSERHGASALTLLRPQLESLLRGCFFAREATHAEIEIFLKKDKMPIREILQPSAETKKQELKINNLVPFAKKLLLIDSNDERLDKWTEDSRKEFNSLIHGGTRVVSAYSNNEKIHFSLTDAGWDYLIKQSTSMIQMSSLALALIAKREETEEVSPLQRMQTASEAFVANTTFDS